MLTYQYRDYLCCHNRFKGEYKSQIPELEVRKLAWIFLMDAKLINWRGNIHSIPHSGKFVFLWRRSICSSIQQLQNCEIAQKQGKSQRQHRITLSAYFAFKDFQQYFWPILKSSIFSLKFCNFTFFKTLKFKKCQWLTWSRPLWSKRALCRTLTVVNIVIFLKNVKSLTCG
jgi:hypothetical protein